MSRSDSLVEEFEKLLNKGTSAFTLQDWQFAYKKVIFKMGLKILDKYPSNAFGQEPPLTFESEGGDGGDGGDPAPLPVYPPLKPQGPYAAGGGPGGGPIIHVAHAALGLRPPPPP